MPRVSLFHFEKATAHGARLLEVAGRYCHDLSLVSTPPQTYSAVQGLNEDVIDLPVARSTSRNIHSTPISGAVFCGINEPSNFGAWMVRALPKLLLAGAFAPDRPVFIYHAASWMRDILLLACPQAQFIAHAPTLSYSLEDVLVPSLPSPDAYLRPELQQMYTGFIKRLPAPANAPARIYLSRRLQVKNLPHMRALENEGALVERFKAHGIEEFIPEQHSIAEQISVISRAKLIVCPGGSGLFGTLFARTAELIVDIEASRRWLHAHRNILDPSGRPWTQVLGEQLLDRELSHGPDHRNWQIDVDALISGMRKLGVL